jgi:hypothetical protein
MSRVSSPRAFNECHRRANLVGGTAAFQNEIQVMGVAVVVEPLDLLSCSRRTGAFSVEVKIVLPGKLLQQRLNRPLAVVAEGLPELVAECLAHRFTPRPKGVLRTAARDVSDFSISYFDRDSVRS